jgi:hypothetical protein
VTAFGLAVVRLTQQAVAADYNPAAAPAGWLVRADKTSQTIDPVDPSRAASSLS